jgi:histidinol-phosphate aminotransferase
MNYVRDIIAEIEGYVPGEQPRDRRYVKLNTNENPYPPAAAVAEALQAFDAERLRLYPDPLATDLRQEAARAFGLTADWTIAGNGSDDLLTIAVRTFVDQGGELAFPDPSYTLYPVLARLQGAGIRRIPLDPAFDLPEDAVEQAGNAALLFIARPNAPTGNAFGLDRMRAVCAGFRGIVWIDEAYVDFADDHCVSFVRDFPNVVVSRSLSKSYSLAGIRLGFACARPELIAEMMKLKDSYNVSMLTQAVGLAALRDPDTMLANAGRIRQTRARVSAALREAGFEVLPSQANFVFAAPPGSAAAYADALREAGILVRYFPGERTGRYVRITIGTDDEMDALLAATRSILGG